MPTTLAEFGSFFVPGRVVERAGEPVRRIAFTPTAAIDHDPNGRYAVESMYVQYFIPAARTHALPLVLLHGGGLTGAMWETTPDGRPGWLHRFLDAGFAVYVVDNVERGRSGFCALPGEWQGEPIQRTDREAWWLFRFGLPEDFATRRPLPGQRFPIAAFDTLLTQFVPRWLTTAPVQTVAFERALERIGRSIVLCHSQGGQIAQAVAAARPDLAAACIAVEPSGFPDALTAANAGQPWVMVMGDFLDRFPLWQQLDAATDAFVAQARAAGAAAERVDLADLGFTGATHMPMMDENSDAIADWLIGWCRERSDPSRQSSGTGVADDDL